MHVHHWEALNNKWLIFDDHDLILKVTRVILLYEKGFDCSSIL